MSHPAPTRKPTGKFTLDNPGITATVLTILITGAFLGAIYNNAKGHAKAPHGAGSATPAAGAPSSSAAPTK